MFDETKLTDDQLRNYLVGNLATDELDAVESRLEESGGCADRIATTAHNLNDTLLTALRKPMRKTPEFVEDSGFQRGMSLARDIGRDWSLAGKDLTPDMTPTAVFSAESETDDGDGKSLEFQIHQPDPATHVPLGDLRDYKLLKKLGEGGMGAVYKALQTRLEKIVALKVLPQDRLKDEETVARFEREMKAVGRLDHPNIVRATDAGDFEGQHFLVMEYVDGVDLSQYVQRHGPMNRKQAVDVIRQAAVGLQYAHEQGLVHRDIKPSNLMVTKGAANDGTSSLTVKILDLGLARLESEPNSEQETQPELTSAGTVMGTIDYMSPEQALDTHNADATSDIYSLGCTLYFLLTGQSLYSGKTAMERLIAHREQPIPSLPKHPASGTPQQSGPSAVPDGTETARIEDDDHSPGFSKLNAVFKGMVAKKQADRYSSMTEVIAALDEMIQTESESITRLQTPVASESESFPNITTPATANSGRRNGISRRTKLAIWASSAAIMLAGIIWISTNKDRWKIQTSGKGVEVSTKDGTVTARDTQTGTSVRITPDGTTVANKGDRNKVSVTENGFELTRDGKLIAKGEKVKLQMMPRSMQTKNHALFFNGKDSYVALPAIREGATSPMTLEAWVTLDPKAPRLATVMEAAGFKVRNYMVGPQWMVIAYGQNGKTELSADDRRSTVARSVHLACVYDKKTFRLFVDGQLRSTSMLPEGFKLSQLKLNKFATIGHSISLHDDSAFLGVIDEVRISTVARYFKNFVPEVRFKPDNNTFALYHFDEAKGNVLVDSSGNNRHGKIHSAVWVKDIGNRRFAWLEPIGPVEARKPKRTPMTTSP